MTETKYLVVDPVTRTINVPDNEKLLGVEFDEKGARKYFQCQKIVGDNIDLTKAKIYINVQNATTQQTGKDRYAVENFKVDGDNVTFEWVLGRKVTAKQGTVKFNVCVMSNDGREWNTTYAEGTTKEGLELLTPEEVETRGSDYLGALTADATASAETILAPYTAYKNGEKITGTYVPLDTSGATAVENDIESGKTAFVNGKEVVGTLPVNDRITRTSMKANRFYKTTIAGITLAFVEVTGKIYPNNDAEKMIMSGKQELTMSVMATDLGDAKPEQILKGRTATSQYGLKIEGTLEVNDKVVKSGTVTGAEANTVTVNTGLNNIEKFILFGNGNKVSMDYGLIDLYWDGTKAKGYSMAQGDTVARNTIGEIAVSGGTVTYTPGKKATYTNRQAIFNWIAIGS